MRKWVKRSLLAIGCHLKRESLYLKTRGPVGAGCVRFLPKTQISRRYIGKGDREGEGEGETEIYSKE